MSLEWQPYREPFLVTLRRTGTVAIIAGLVFAIMSRRGVGYWPAGTVLMLWPALGGHWVEIFFELGAAEDAGGARAQVGARMVVWFLGGCVLAAGMYGTAILLNGGYPGRWRMWWIGGVAFIGIELVVHLVLYLRGVDCFYNGRR